MAAHSDYRDDLLAFEFENLSLLMHFWAKKDFSSLSGKEKERMIKKVPKLRSAVIAGLGKGGHEFRIPRELVNADYSCVLHALRFIKRKYKSLDGFKKNAPHPGWFEIPCPIEIENNDEMCTIKRPIPIPKQELDWVVEELFKHPDNKSRIAYGVAGQRLMVKDSKVHRSGPGSSRIAVTKSQQCLISVFLDLCSIKEPDNEVRQTLAKILMALFALECNCLLLHYLIYNAQKIEEQLFTGEYELDELTKVCDEIIGANDKFSFSPFVRLV